MQSLSDMRCLLFVPGDDAGKLRNAEASETDALVLDLEDSVLPARKEEARHVCAEFADQSKRVAPLLLRVNPCRSSWFQQDMDACSQIRPDGLVLPKCESPSDIQAAEDACKGRHCEIPIYAMIETPLGLLRAQEIATASKAIAALAFGAEDYCAAAGIQRTADQIELLHARSSIVTVARAYGLAAIDSPSFSLQDLDVVRKDATRTHALGFSGMFVIHPKHIPIVAEVLAPAEQEMRRAQNILDQAAIHPAGAFAWEGEMIDEATLRRARRVLERRRSNSGKA